MEICMKETLKKMRQSKKVTQEQLANHLSITPQSVGKWERGEGYPDITLLPAIALYFGVTVDELLGVGKKRIEDEINRYKRKSIELKNQGNIKENYELWKEAFATFPEEHCVQHEYIDALWCVYASEPISVIDGVIQPWDEKRQEKGKEILSIGDKLLLTCTDRNITDSVTEVLCYTAKNMGNIPLAKNYADKLGSLRCTRESILELVLEDDDGIEQAQNNILAHLEMLTRAIGTVRVKKASSPEEQERFEQLCIDLWKCVLGDRNLGFYHCRVADEYSRLATNLAIQKKEIECLCALEKMAYHSIAFDQSGDGVYTQPWLDGKRYSCKSFSKNYASNDSFIRLKFLDNNIYDFVREHSRFVALANQLKQVANEVDLFTDDQKDKTSKMM